MNFNDIESAWKKEPLENIDLPTNLGKIEQANLPVEKIKKNLKKELPLQIVTVILLGFLPYLLNKQSDMNFLIPFYLLYSVSVVICLLFTIKLYIHYKNFTIVALNTKDSLYEVYYNIRLFIETYKSFTYALVPFGLAFVIFIPFGLENDVFLKVIQNPDYTTKFIFSFIFLVIIFIILIWFMTEFHVKIFYGKHSNEIKKLIDELKE